MTALNDVTWPQVNDFVNSDGSKRGVDTIEVFDVSDLTFPLASGRYVLKNDITISQSITTEVGSTVYIQADGGGRTMTLDGTLGDLIVGNATFGILVLTGFDISITGASSNLFNTTGMLVSCEKVNMLFAGALAQNIGTMANSPLSISIIDCIVNGFQGGLVVDNQATRTIIDRSTFTSDKTGTGSVITIGPNCPRSEVFDCFFDTANGESLFNINASFTGSAVIQNYTKVNTNSASYAVGGLDNKSIYVRNDQSRSIGSFYVSGNATATTISTANTWTDFNFGANALPASNIERWTLTNTTTGELRYDGLEHFEGDIFASFSASSTGGTQEFEIRAVKNGLELTDPIISSRETGSDMGNQSFLSPVTADTGDLFRLQVQNIDGTSNITFKNVSVAVR